MAVGVDAGNMGNDENGLQNACFLFGLPIKATKRDWSAVLTHSILDANHTFWVPDPR